MRQTSGFTVDGHMAPAARPPRLPISRNGSKATAGHLYATTQIGPKNSLDVEISADTCRIRDVTILLAAAARLGAYQIVKVSADGGMALASASFESAPIGDGHTAMAILDDSCLLQRAGGNGNACALNPQH